MYLNSGNASIISCSNLSTSIDSVASKKTPYRSNTTLVSCSDRTRWHDLNTSARLSCACRYLSLSNCGLKWISALKRAELGPTMTDLTSCTDNTISSDCSMSRTKSVRAGTVCPRKRRFRLMMNTATAPIILPTAIEPTASNAGLPVTWVSVMLVAATPTPMTATESSRSTAGFSGSVVCERYFVVLIWCFAASCFTSDHATDRV
mmetsp:Transcript_34114/g.77283  ORF Transcript_34114/g.77283 Transcript_34114/m.77283 type:complete len:205 (-) Transcript_34114:1011-1625(-)